MIYRKGDFVLVKSLDWYNLQMKDYKRTICYRFIHPFNEQPFTKRIKKYCGEIVEIRKADNERNCYFVNYHGQQLKFPWYDNMFEKKIN